MQYFVEQKFLQVAQANLCWICLPEPPQLSELWLGRAGYLPVPQNCPAPISNNPDYPFAGLAVDPELRPDAFLPDSLELARVDWDQFRSNGQLEPGYVVIEEGDERGLVQFGGCYLYSEVSLLNMFQSNPQGEMLSTTDAQRRELFQIVARDLNSVFGTTLITYGSQLLIKQGFQPAQFNLVLWFGPGNRSAHLPGAMTSPT